MGDTTSKEGVNRAERGDTGPLNPEEAKKAQKGWGESMLDATMTAGGVLLTIVQPSPAVISAVGRSKA